MAKKITQATFDAAVKENMDEFGMEAEEAVQDAIKQFESQGVSLAGIIKSPPSSSGSGSGAGGAEGRLPDFHALAVLLADPGAAIDALQPLAERVAAQLQDKDVCVYAGRQNALPLLITACERLQAVGSSAGVRTCFQALARLLDGQPDLLSPPPGQLTEDVIVQDLPPNAATQALCRAVTAHVGEAEVLAAGLLVIRHSCIKHEVNRQAFVDNGIVDTLMDTLRRYPGHAGAAGAAAECLRALTLDDDVRVPFGKAHSTARMIVADAQGLSLLVASLRALQHEPTAVPALAAAIARLAVRHEFCQQIVDLGGAVAALQAMAAHSAAPAVQQACCSLLRAVAGNDSVKGQISQSGGIEAILGAMQTNLRAAGVVEQGCAALAALCLRNENNCRLVVASGGASAIANAMQSHVGNVRVQRQACQALRNLVARTPELREPILANGVEALVRTAMQTHAACGDVAKGALRDLGCQVELRELWTGTAGLGVAESQPIDDGGDDL